jgi:tRNA(fMet)-specific endonuclease VapC
MALYVIDTDILSLYHDGDILVCQRVNAHPPDELAITVITVEEQLSGWYAYLRRAKQPPEVERAYGELAEAVPFLAAWKILEFPQPAFARYRQLVAMKLNVGKPDLRIAAIVLENNAILVTRNVRDFSRVPNLVIENWAV